jgi:hypothetical protein
MSVIEDDIRTIVGGHFTPDALSPAVYDATLARARARPKEYLDAFEALFLGLNFDALIQSRLYLPTFLKLLAGADPARVRALAAALLKLYDSVMVTYDAARDKRALFALLPEETVRLLQRLEVRRVELRALK